MKYVCLVYGEENKIGAMTDDECMAYDQGLRNAGRCLASEALQPVRRFVTRGASFGNITPSEVPFRALSALINAGSVRTHPL